MESKKQYIAPALTVVEFKTEAGFAQSGEPKHYYIGDAQPKSGYSGSGIQEMGSGTLGSGSWNWF